VEFLCNGGSHGGTRKAQPENVCSTENLTIKSANSAFTNGASGVQGA